MTHDSARRVSKPGSLSLRRKRRRRPTSGAVKERPVSRDSRFGEFSRDTKTSQGTASVALTQRGVESLFPTHVVDGPDDLRFVSCGETCGPHVAVAFVIRDVQAVNHGHAAGEFALRFDVHEMLRL